MAGALTRWDPTEETTDLRSRLARLADDLGKHRHGTLAPAIEIHGLGATSRTASLLRPADAPGQGAPVAPPCDCQTPTAMESSS